MLVSKSVKFSDFHAKGSIEEPTNCPICKHAIKPVELYLGGYWNEGKEAFISGLYLCKHCYEVFTTLHKCKLQQVTTFGGSVSGYSLEAELIYCEPNRFVKNEFPSEVKALSPKFDTIYNQALAAECSGLDEIAGLGYRKAVEFLVKDFAIHEHPEKEEDIKSMMLSPCIEEFIDAPQINTLATKSAWIGNDEAHYVRRHPSLDVEDMKRFIHALVSYISMLLTVEEAEQIQRA